MSADYNTRKTGQQLDITGQRFGKLIAVERVASFRDAKRLYTRWKCRCDCGKERVTRLNSLRTGRAKSCGCARKEPRPYKRASDMVPGTVFGKLTLVERAASGPRSRWVVRCECGKVKDMLAQALKQGAWSCGCRGGNSNHPLYQIWHGIKTRCQNPAHRAFSNYGGRGISICDRWAGDFRSFAADVGERPSLRHSLDRINPNGNYEPGNVRWATPLEQIHNQRLSRERVGALLDRYEEQAPKVIRALRRELLG